MCCASSNIRIIKRLGIFYENFILCDRIKSSVLLCLTRVAINKNNDLSCMCLNWIFTYKFIAVSVCMWVQYGARVLIKLWNINHQSQSLTSNFQYCAALYTSLLNYNPCVYLCFCFARFCVGTVKAEFRNWHSNLCISGQPKERENRGRTAKRLICPNYGWQRNAYSREG